ncbi:GerMN domain-containing protein [Nocardioides sp. TF02-7]|uniref:GerMN domain-containing protein n=1 Tax=Nocardioides sp. TF02-7 TaxID=2917724 RepID=UPI001F066614|nr:GerMN domain-containing protein [Nocardioides sp. TF02-7]UMG91832.1 GerMN domain-containing protein [Nocardioides sp. TF02-7]
MPSTRRAGGRRTPVVVVVVAAAATFLSCGVPGSGTVRTVDDDEVPYGLLDPPSPSAPPAPIGGPARAPVVVWTGGERLVPEATGGTCSENPATLVERLLAELVAGPSEETRAAGRSSAVPPDFGLDLVDLRDGTAEIGIEPETPLSAEQLPVAVGQVVLTVTSAPTVRSVVLVDDGEPVQVPLPGGVLTDEPVRASDYAELLPARLRAPGAIGCPRR